MERINHGIEPTKVLLQCNTMRLRVNAKMKVDATFLDEIDKA